VPPACTRIISASAFELKFKETETA